MNMLVTGASGFIGSYIVEDGLRRGHQVWAGVRGSSSRAYLRDGRTRFACLDLSDKALLVEQLRALKAQTGGRGWDVVVHAAGATKCLHADDFYRTNYDGTVHLVEALREAGMMPRRLVYLSSLSVFGAIREQPVRKPTASNPWVYAPILGTDTPQPNTDYGRSKWKAEQWLAAQRDVPCTILRPTGVYGPRERDYFLMARSISRHIDFSVGYRPQEITFVYVMDVVQAVFKCAESPQAEGRAYFLSDGQVYNSRRFSDLLQQSMGNPWVLHVKAPLWFLRGVCALGGALGRVTGRMSALNMDKYHILSQRNWQCDIGPARRDFGYEPQWPLERGVPAAVRWYRENGWL
ncbi:MAG TPA: NAD-dependent dehydratase [Prevotellaceae bacterium]|nr:NAD-dependent dehydratase [Prevotellaceae bacterium]HBE55187.1 NAD-dependent dehydratase [Prevotellaceae bacterium]